MPNNEKPAPNDEAFLAQHVTPIDKKLSWWAKVWGGFMTGCVTVAIVYFALINARMEKQGERVQELNKETNTNIERVAQSLKSHIEKDDRKFKAITDTQTQLGKEFAGMTKSMDTHFIYINKALDEVKEKLP